MSKKLHILIETYFFLVAGPVKFLTGQVKTFCMYACMYLFSFLCKCTSQNNHPTKSRLSHSIQIKLFNLVKILVFSHIAIISENQNIMKCQSFPISCSPSFDVISHLKKI